jgi:hypothetical protein
MTPMVIWLVGEPGVGKTTLARLFMEHWGTPVEVPKPKWTLFGDRACAAGFWRGDKFDGADTLPISDIKPAMAYWAEHLKDREITILDGDKLAHDGAVRIAEEAGANLFCFLLENPGVAAKRRLARGTTQNEAWVRGRATKSRNFYERFPGFKQQIDAGLYIEAQMGYVILKLATHHGYKFLCHQAPQ